MAYEKQNFLDGQIITADHLNHIEDGIIDLLMVYPVGSIYLSVNATSPASLFGGTWERIEDRFLLAAGSTYTAGDMGGEAAHTLTVSEMPSHNHTYTIPGNETGTSWYGANGTAKGAPQSSGDSGDGEAHNNMPPYLAVYMWKRVA